MTNPDEGDDNDNNDNDDDNDDYYELACEVGVEWQVES